MYKETRIFKKLNKLKYDSATPNFIEIESLVISIQQTDEVLDYCKHAYALDSPISNIMYKMGKEQAFINGIGLLQTLFYQQNCIKKLYKFLTNDSLKVPEDIDRIRKARNFLAGHPDDRKYIPDFTFHGCDGYSFDEEAIYRETIYYEEIIIRQEKFVSNVLNKLIVHTNR